MSRFTVNIALFFIFLLSACTPTQVGTFQLRGVWHMVTSGQTVAQVAKQYHVDRQTVAELNNLADGPITERKQIFIPTGKGDVPGDGQGARTKPTPAASSGTPPTEATTVRTNADTEPIQTSPYCDETVRSCMRWPVKGGLIERFGVKNQGASHDGIDIGVNDGTQVVAADTGIVIYSGNGIKGYGNLIIIRHPENIITVYAHNQENQVKEGSRVQRGDPIALSGHSGATATPHLHFEVRQNEQPIDPTGYLPKP